MAKVSKKEAENIYEEISQQSVVPAERFRKGITIEECRLETVEKMTKITDLAVDTLTNIMEDEKAKNHDKLRAAKIVLEYAIGRPREASFVDDASFSKNGNVGRIIIEGQVTPEAVRETIEANFYGDGGNNDKG